VPRHAAQARPRYLCATTDSCKYTQLARVQLTPLPTPLCLHPCYAVLLCSSASLLGARYLCLWEAVSKRLVPDWQQRHTVGSCTATWRAASILCALCARCSASAAQLAEPAAQVGCSEGSMSSSSSSRGRSGGVFLAHTCTHTHTHTEFPCTHTHSFLAHSILAKQHGSSSSSGS
jgi:hypothetical protein